MTTSDTKSALNVVIQRVASDLQLSEAARRVHDVLPQTQCQRCGEADCAHYAQAVVDGRRAINRCQPGGQLGIIRIARALGDVSQSNATLDPECGVESPMHVAVIDEAWCIGCTLCMKVCPTDSIIGSNKCMHTVIEPYCTGCDLCALACPVDCISMHNVSGEKTGWNAWSQEQAKQASQRYEARLMRRQQNDKKQQHKQSSLDASPQNVQLEAANASHNNKQSAIQAALQRARAKRAGHS